MSEPGIGLAWNPGHEAGAGPEGWRRLAFPGVFLVVLIQTAAGVADHSAGGRAVAGYLAVAGFVAGYLLALRSVTGGGPWFVPTYLTLYALFAVGLWAAHEDALPMAMFLGVLAIARFGKRFVVIALGLAAADVVLPRAFGWPQRGEAFSLLIVLAANYAFFRLLWANVALHQARAELAGLAAEGERQRIARDLHDLLGHSLTTITVKSALARRLADAGEAERSRAEVAEIEEIARGALTDVRAAVAGYRQVSLAGELAAGRELARAMGVELEAPPSTDVVDPRHHELFGWVVREGLTNVIRHAGAGRCAVTVGRHWISIVDDGAPAGPGRIEWRERLAAGGGDSASAPMSGESGSGPGSGLAGLRERVERAGGTLHAGPDRAGGWRLEVDMEPAGSPAPRRGRAATDAADGPQVAGAGRGRRSEGGRP